jgi:hypothetical protein
MDDDSGVHGPSCCSSGLAAIAAAWAVFAFDIRYRD